MEQERVAARAAVDPEYRRMLMEDAYLAAQQATEESWKCDWESDDLNPGPECPYCAGDMCGRFDGLGCTHDIVERHGYAANRQDPDEWRGELGPPGTLPPAWEALAVAACSCGSDECRSCRAIAKHWPVIEASIRAELLERERGLEAEELDHSAPWSGWGPDK